MSKISGITSGLLNANNVSNFTFRGALSKSRKVSNVSHLGRDVSIPLTRTTKLSSRNEIAAKEVSLSYFQPIFSLLDSFRSLQSAYSNLLIVIFFINLNASGFIVIHGATSIYQKWLGSRL